MAAKQLLFDEKANQSQRDALMQIATGQAGGMPFEILVTTFSNVLPPQYVPFEFHLIEDPQTHPNGLAPGLP